MRIFSTILTALLFLNLLRSDANAEAIGDVVSRVQTNLNRVAAGVSPIEPQYATNVDRLVEAFSALLSSDPTERARGMQVLDTIETQASVALRRYAAARKWPVDRLYERYNAIEAALQLEPGLRGEDAPWLRFVVVGDKAIDALGKGARSGAASSLKIPCAAVGHLKSLTLQPGERAPYFSDLTDCPKQERNQVTVVVTGPDQLGAYLAAADPRRSEAAPEEPEIPAVNPGTTDWARRYMAGHTDEVEAILSQGGDVRTHIDYGMFLYYYRPATKERDERIRRSFAAAIGLAQRGAAETYLARYDYGFLRANMDQLVDAMLEKLETHEYPIPCSIVFRDPNILVHTEPRYGGGGDAFLPTSDCDAASPEMAGYPFALVKKFRHLANAAGKYGTQGTIWTAIYVLHTSEQYHLQSDPRAFLDDNDTGSHPYDVWSYLSIPNNNAFRVIDAAYAEAFAQLQAFYRKLGLTGAEAVIAARIGLKAIVLGPDCGAAPAPASFRKLLLDRAPLAEVRAYAESQAWRDGDVLEPFRSCAHFAGIEPLAHLAILDLEGFAYLRGLTKELSQDERARLDLVLDIDAPNAFGKTPLMTALQQRMPEAVAWLIANGADVNAATDSTSLAFGRRTPLMYAAASGSLDMIKALLAAGSDPLQADTMGRRAVHYLLGDGPSGQPPNTTLSDAEIRAAYDLLR